MQHIIFPLILPKALKNYLLQKIIYMLPKIKKYCSVSDYSIFMLILGFFDITKENCLLVD